MIGSYAESVNFDSHAFEKRWLGLRIAYRRNLATSADSIISLLTGDEFVRVYNVRTNTKKNRHV